jgi:peptide-methionine (S)-S-oxide reductase
MATAIFAAGCFWGVEETFRTKEGVLSTTVGYTGGWLENPTYKDVCTDKTGHAEGVLIEYDPAIVSYEELLEIFWANHDPTQVNAQGPDIGTQYRTVVFYTTPTQKNIAQESKTRMAERKIYSKPIATEILPAVKFWPAEDYHQKYFEKRGGGSCHI